jgi:MoaA/NifB/PqqE/SkfB family radical SAM enzyme
LKDILRFRPRAFYISLYGASSSIHDNVTGVPGSFDKTINVAKKIRDANISVVFNVMLLAENCDDLEEIIKLASQLGIEYRTSMSLVYRNDGGDSPMKHFIGDMEKIKNLLRIIKEDVGSTEGLIDSIKDSEYMCGAGVTSICLSPDGTVHPCVSLKVPLGNIKTDSLINIWNGTARANIVSSLKWENTSKCKSCPRKSRCPHCAGMSQAETGDMFSCNTCDEIISKCICAL